MAKRKEILAAIKVAGYHSDQRSFLRLYTENRINFQVAKGAYDEGAKQRKTGVRCGCHECANRA